MSAVYSLTLRQLAGRWRLVTLTILAAMPVLITVVVLSSDGAPSVAEFENVVFNAMLAGAIIPLVVLAIGAAAFGNEVEDRTLANLTLASVPRWQIVAPKLLASFSIAAPFIVASTFITAWLAYLGDPTAVAAVVVSALAAVALYVALFVWLGLVSTQAIGLGLLYIVVWEGLFSQLVAGARMLSVRYHALAIMHGLDERRFAELSHVNGIAAALVSAAVLGTLVFLTVRRLRRMDVP